VRVDKGGDGLIEIMRVRRGRIPSDEVGSVPDNDSGVGAHPVTLPPSLRLQLTG
jgi:hypothetical protein